MKLPKSKTFMRKNASKPTDKPCHWTAQYHVPLSQSALAGMIAENLVRQYLKLRGWQVMDRNYETKFGEIDIIASKWHADLHGYPTIIFVEVKSKRKTHGLSPEMNVTRAKQNKIAKTAKLWIASHSKLKAVYRFDVASVWLEKNKLPRIKYIPAAFCMRQDFGW